MEQARRELTGLPGIIRKLFGFAWDIPADWACHTARIPPARSSGGSDPSGILSAELFLYAVRALLLDARRMRATQSGRTSAALERVRASVFGAAGTGELPAVSSASVTTYLSFLLPRISLPFKASVVAGKPGRRLTVVSLSVRHPGAQSEGILCAAKVGRGEKLIPLKDVVIDESGQNRELIEDYRCWFLSPGRYGR